MIRLSRLADYGIVMMTQLATRPERFVTAPEISLATGLPVPTVSKILKRLAQSGLLESLRGAKGGYALVRDPEDVAMTEIITAVDGPIALTECTVPSDGACDFEALCPTRTNWRKINDAVVEALSGITLADMTLPSPSFLPMGPVLPRPPAEEREA